MKLACTVCGEPSVAIVEREDEKAPAFTKDDVLDAHDFPQTWHGPVTEIEDVVLDVPVSTACDQWT